ncbi:hypothetical protein GPECTOR_9g564 [Gonium pectorale]|uniref:Ion transport domain-containing protein n=1 Tax=Gonium pectorale TaxID=33097 RepID=A0A150GT57_GONPE|nr:hypothetical protein GPECTOR_9g564 [Gonium pectorale]|eukprot:KXZ52520.1 hypothetical protein GPECTOR_9g564 [Gonium pectorale]
MLHLSPSRVQEMDEHDQVHRLSYSPEFTAEKQKDPSFTLLHFVAMLGTGTLAEALDVKAREPDAMQRFTRYMRHLITRDDNVFVTDKYGCTPLQLAAALGNKIMVAALLEPYGPPASSSFKGLERCSGEYGEFHKYINHQDGQTRIYFPSTKVRFSALHGAVSHGEAEVVIQLLRNGAEPQVMDVNRKTAFRVAPSLASLQDLLWQILQNDEGIEMLIVVELMAEVLEQQSWQAAKAAQAESAAPSGASAPPASAPSAASHSSHTSRAGPAADLPAAPATPLVTGAGPPVAVPSAVLGGFGGRNGWAAKVVAQLRKTPDLPTDAERRLGGVASAVLGRQIADVGVTIRRFFRKLYKARCYLDMSRYLEAAVRTNHFKLTEMMIDLLCDECPAVLREPEFQGTLDPLVSSFPPLFHRLLFKLQMPYHIIKVFIEQSDVSLLNDMALFPIFRHLMDLISTRDTTKAFDASASSRKLLVQLLRQGSGQPLSPAAPGSGTAALEPVPELTSSVAAPATPPPPIVAWPSLGRRLRSKCQLLSTDRRVGTSSVNGSGGSGSGSQQRELLTVRTLCIEKVVWAALKGGKRDNVEAVVESIVGWVDTNSRERTAVFITGITPDLIKELAICFPTECATLLNVVSRDVLELKDMLQVPSNLLEGKSHWVKCSHVRKHYVWRQTELQKLKEIQGYDEAVIDALVEYGVRLEYVEKATVEQGATPALFAALIQEGFTGAELVALISNNYRLDAIQMHLEECAQPPPEGVPADFAEKLEVPMSMLLRDMLKQHLSPRIVDVILEEGPMFETTKYNNFRPGRPLLKMYPAPLFTDGYTHHFVQLLLINWRRGVKDNRDPTKWSIAPWHKDFIDTVWERNDPLFTKLKSAFDNKLTDTQLYIQGDGSPEVGEHESADNMRKKRDRREREQEWADRGHILDMLLRIFVSNSLLIHRWSIFLMARLCLWLLAVWRTRALPWIESLMRRQLEVRQRGRRIRSGTVDAAVLALPILNFVDPGEGDILTALADADAPPSWFHYAIVRALYSLHWGQFGRVLTYLDAAAYVQFAAAFLAFFTCVLEYREHTVSEPGDDGERLTPLRALPPIEVTLCISVVLSASMLVERALEWNVYTPPSWVTFGRQLELACHSMVWLVAIIVWCDRAGALVPALSGLAMLLFVLRLTLFALVNDKLSTAVLALLEILSDSRYFFLLIATVYGGFVLAAAGLRSPDMQDPTAYSTALFTVLLGDFQSSQLSDERTVWRYPGFSTVLLSVYAVLMLILFLNLLIATMNDTYDRVREFREVEVMRLRTHMMVFVKTFMLRNAKGLALPSLNGDVLHLLLQPEELKSGRWASRSGPDPSEFRAWEGRISYMRNSIVRELEGVVRDISDKATERLETRTLTALRGLEARLKELEARIPPLRTS